MRPPDAANRAERTMYLGIDLGTSGVKALVIDEGQSVVAEATHPVASLRAAPPWSEQDPADWITAVEGVFTRLSADHPGLLGQIRGVGLSGHMHGAVLLDAGGQVLRPCIMWDDGRSAQECAELEAMADFHGIGGNLVMAGFTAPKLRWVEKHEPQIFEKTAKVLLPKDYLRLWLTGEYGAEMSDAAGTLWLDVAKRAWSPALLAATHLEIGQMPTLYEGSEPTGALRPALCEAWGFQPGAVVAGGAGDNAAAACGMGIVADGAFFSLGTSGVVFAPTPSFRPCVEKAVHAFCHAVPGSWHQMGVILAAASCLDWQARQMGAEVGAMLGLLGDGVSSPSEVQFLPYLTGVRTPHNDPEARASFAGMTSRTEPADMVQAVLEGVGFALKDCVDALSAGGTEIGEAYAVGGGSRSELWLQILANICDVTLLTPKHGEYGAAMGAARLGLLAESGADDLSVFSKPPVQKAFHPDPAARAAYQDAHQRWVRLHG